MSNLLTIRLYNEQTGDYRPLRTEWVDDSDMLPLLRYMQTQPPIEGFYEYTLTLTGKRESLRLRSICADPAEYSRYLFYKQKPGVNIQPALLPLANDETNTIEQ